jgi:hypothetical protein
MTQIVLNETRPVDHEMVMKLQRFDHPDDCLLVSLPSLITNPQRSEIFETIIETIH